MRRRACGPPFFVGESAAIFTLSPHAARLSGETISIVSSGSILIPDVMPGLVPGIHAETRGSNSDFLRRIPTWMAGTTPGHDDMKLHGLREMLAIVELDISPDSLAQAGVRGISLDIIRKASPYISRATARLNDKIHESEEMAG